MALRLPLFLLLVFLQHWAIGQITDDFSDGDFTQNPVWQGDMASFKINATGELQLNAAAAGQAVLAVGGVIADSTIWDLRFRLSFAPSAGNLLRIYLLADQAALPVANGYFLEIGENGSADALRLFRQDGAAAKTLLATGVPAFVATNPDIHLRVRRTKTGDWEVQAAAQNDALQVQCTATDATYAGGMDRYFGFQCTFTVSNATKFFFDNISILPDAPDSKPPVLIGAQADNATQVTVVFDELLDSLSAVQAVHYTLSGGVGQPLAVSLLPAKNAVSLTFSTPLATGTYILQTTGIKDIAGNASAVQSAGFQFVKIEAAEAFDLIINELMADPSPVAGLPEVEWVEIYNRSAKTIDLKTLLFADASGSTVALPAYLMPPGGYAVLCALANAPLVRPFSKDTVLAVPMSSTLLNNEGDVLTLSTVTGLVVDEVAYQAVWHTDPVKRNGGWSLERINPGLPCLGATNWQSCPILPGGSPGQVNASLDLSPDVTAPRLVSAYPESSAALQVLFSESLDKNTALDPNVYQLSPPRSISSVEVLTDHPFVLRLSLAEALQPGVVYTLSASPAVSDCSGNTVAADNKVLTGLAEAPESQDVVINEIMADPDPGIGLPEVEWIELHNRSARIIDLGSLSFSDGSSVPATLPGYLMFPGNYVVIAATSVAATLRPFSPGAVLATSISSSLLNNDGDVLTLSTINGMEIDRVAYQLDWHTDLAKRNGGYSLERINPNLQCPGGINWVSGTQPLGGTPGAANAAFNPVLETIAPRLVTAITLSPDTLQLFFSEILDKSTADIAAGYRLDPPRLIASVEQLTKTPAQVLLVLAEPLELGVFYALTAHAPLADCSGNTVSSSDTSFVFVSQYPEPQDIILNEVLFYPPVRGVRYLEFYNRSDKTFTWSEFLLANDLLDGDTLAVLSKRLFRPGEYHVFTSQPDTIKHRYQNINPENLLRQSLPSMPDKSGTIRLLWQRGHTAVTLDSFVYDEAFHNQLYNTSQRRGVALERIRADGPTNAPANWTSAAPVLTGAPGTPTLKNAQKVDSQPFEDDLIRLSTERLSPDFDGYEDFLDIVYRLPQEGYAATMTVFDSDGLPLKRLVRQQLIGTEGALRWDGDLDDGTMARPGIYVLFLEIFNPNGEVRRVKKSVAVVKRF